MLQTRNIISKGFTVTASNIISKGFTVTASNIISKGFIVTARFLSNYSVGKPLENVAEKFSSFKNDGNNVELRKVLNSDLKLYLNFINEQEQADLMKEIDKTFRRTKYEYDHWDGVSIQISL